MRYFLKNSNPERIQSWRFKLMIRKRVTRRLDHFKCFFIARASEQVAQGVEVFTIECG